MNQGEQQALPLGDAFDEYVAKRSGDAFDEYVATRAARKRPSKPREYKSAADAPMVPTAMEKAQRDNAALLSQFKRWKRSEHVAMLQGQHVVAYRAMLGILKRLPASSKELVLHLRTDWVGKLNANERAIVLHMISARISHTREMDGRHPFDDPLWDQPPNLYLICRKLIKGI